MSRQSWPLIVNSVLLIGLCLFLGGAALAGFAHWDPCMWVTSVVLMLPTFTVAGWQYLAVFRACPVSAKRLLISLAIIGALLVLALAGAILEPIGKGIWLTWNYVLGIVGPIALVVSWLAVTGVLNLRWFRNLLRSAAASTVRQNDSKPRTRFTLREFAALIAAVSAALAGFSLGIRDIAPERALHVSPEIARLSLPHGATDVCVTRGSRGMITYDFSIDESGFWEWANSRVGSLEAQSANVAIKPIAGSFSIFSCSDDPSVYGAPREIKRGWYYSWQKEDRAIKYAYDSDNQRAYYHAHFH